MRILHVCSATEIGGGEVHLTDLVAALSARGHEVHVAVRPGSPLLDRVRQTARAIHLLPLRNALDAWSAYRLSRVIRDHALDIIHAHVARDYFPAIAAALWSGRARAILTRHHYLPLRRNVLSRAALRRAARIIAVSESVRGGLLGRFDLPPDHVVTIPNWIRIEEITPLPDRETARAQLGLRRPHVITTVGRLTPAKGQDDLLRAAHHLGDLRARCEFVIVGEASAKDRTFQKRLSRLVRDLHLEECVRFLGHLSDLRPVWAASDLFVLPSHNEGFSLTLAHAMAAGIPAIAFAAGGPAEIITDGETGILVPPRDWRALAESIRALLEDPTRRAQLARAACEAVRRRFDRQTLIARIESVYAEALTMRLQEDARANAPHSLTP